jgi:hypothetical protein
VPKKAEPPGAENAFELIGATPARRLQLLVTLDFAKWPQPESEQPADWLLRAHNATDEHPYDEIRVHKVEVF